MKEYLRQIPAINNLLESPAAVDLIAQFGIDMVTTHLRQAVDEIRRVILAGEANGTPPTADSILAMANQTLEADLAPSLHGAINATGVIIHTNLGRATLSKAAQAAVLEAAQGYGTLEFDIVSGKRGKRDIHAERLLTQVTGAEAALLVNNTASAVMMMLSTLCTGKRVIISRGQLVEIGGGFRVPDVMAQSGAILKEVGTTNRTHLRDYENAILEDPENTGAIMVAHHSNFKIVGFTTEPDMADLAALAKKHNIPLLFDQGSGCMFDTAKYGLDHEPTVQEGVTAGADLIAFSGDKLLGGPQAGIIIGRADLVATLKRHPLARALRPDKLCIAGLAATLGHYLKGDALQEIPVWAMIEKPLDKIKTTAEAWQKELKAAGIDSAVVASKSTVGGGSLPGTSFDTWALKLTHPQLETFNAQLRQSKPHVIGRIQEDALLLDPRTVQAEQSESLVKAILEAFGK
ncbi:MAG: L-seryl-tRNA(Sec) selenium transferase [Anaerolineae bacterium]